MRKLHILMPMAGEGSRFKKEGWTTPKPLIMLNGKPLFLHAISSVYLEGVEMKYSFILRAEHIREYGLDLAIKKLLPEANIFSVERTTRGAVETCLMAESAVDPDDAVIVMDCDLEFISFDFNQKLVTCLALSPDKAEGGALVSFTSDSPKYSYAEVDAEGKVIRTAEKEVISNHALCGAYFFATGRRFIEAAHELMNEPDFKKPEYYVSLLYNYLLRDGETVLLSEMDEYYSYGTPEELKRYM